MQATEQLENRSTSPIEKLGAGKVVWLRFHSNGKPRRETRASMISIDALLAKGFDSKFERNTDAIGYVRIRKHRCYLAFFIDSGIVAVLSFFKTPAW